MSILFNSLPGVAWLVENLTAGWGGLVGPRGRPIRAIYLHVRISKNLKFGTSTNKRC